MLPNIFRYDLPLQEWYQYSRKFLISLMKILDIIPRSTIWTDYIKVLTQDGKRRQAQDQDLETVLNEAVEVEYMHEGRVGSLGKSSMYNRNIVNR